MALMEFDADELRALQAEHSAAKPAKIVVDKLAADPATRLDFFRLIKKVSPNTPIPELDTLNAGMSEVQKLAKDFDDYKSALDKKDKDARKASRERQVEDEIGRGRKFLRQQGYDSEGVTAVENFMEKRGLVDFEAAEALFARTQIPEESIIPSNYGQSWDLFAPQGKDDPLAEILKMPRSRGDRAIRVWAEKEARQTLNDIRNGRVAA